MATTRREFLATTIGSATFIGVSPWIPQALLQAGEKSAGKDRILVVIQLSGGNDGLNTIVPVGDDEYYKRRFTLAIDKNSVHKIDDYCGFHPAMNGFSKLLEDGHLSIINGVGYPNPNRSHFESMDLWHSAHQKNDRFETGWLGGYLQARQLQSQIAAVHVGEDEQPLALRCKDVQVPSIRSLERFRMELSGNEHLQRVIDKTVLSKRARNDVLDFVQQSTQKAIDTSRRIEKTVGAYQPSTDYPYTSLGRKLLMVAKLIGSNMNSNIYYVTLDGFDTHSKQAEAHAGLLTELSGALSAFLADMQDQGNLDRVLTLSFSEFGRRLKENASLGTDHGAAAPVFLAGGTVKAGVHGTYPSLTELTDGDLKFHTDYRQIYATILERWFQCDSKPILGKPFTPLNVLS